jgi:hypothetical protein
MVLGMSRVSVFGVVFIGVEGVFGVILIGDIGKGILGVPEGPGAVIEIWLGGCGIGGDSDTPAFLQPDWRTEGGGVKDYFGSLGCVEERRSRMVVRDEHVDDWRWAAVVVLRVSKSRQGKQRGDGGQSQNGRAQASSPVFGVASTLIQTGRSSKKIALRGIRGEISSAFLPDEREFCVVVNNLPGCCRMGGY